MNDKGFTLVELLAVITIIALIAIITAPGILNVINSSKNSSNEVLYNNIKTASIELYEEVDYMNESFYIYDRNGKTTSKVSIIDNSITINIQTLVSNGFLTGVNNEDKTSNVNNRIVINSNNEDITECLIKITKEKKNNKVSYSITSSSDNEICPTNDDF